jgi:hypothetical protein
MALLGSLHLTHPRAPLCASCISPYLGVTAVDSYIAATAAQPFPWAFALYCHGSRSVPAEFVYYSPNTDRYRFLSS